jgi:hypothetical protein
LPGSDHVRPDDSEIPPASPATNQVFIISRDPLQAFIAALSPALRDCEEFTIIVDRRRAALKNVAARPAIERRHHPWVDAKVETDGFAIVPLSTTDDPQNPPWIECVVDHQSAADDAEADERELWRALEFERHKARVGRHVRVSAIVGAVSVLVGLFVQMPAGMVLMNRAPLVALPTSERTPELPSEPHALSVVEAPAPRRPSRPPAERIGRPRDTRRTPTEVVSPPPSPQFNASRQSKWRPANPEPAPPARPESVSVPADSAPTARLDVTPPRAWPLTVASPASTSPPATAPEPARQTQSNSPPRAWPGRPSASAPDPTRSAEGSPPRIAHTASTPGEATVSPSSAPRQPSARGLEAWIQALQRRVKGDVDTAGAEAKRQIDELKPKTVRSLDEMRRVWHNAAHGFSDKDANQAHGRSGRQAAVSSPFGLNQEDDRI